MPVKSKDVIINIISTKTDGADDEKTEIMTKGKYKKTDDGYKISYEESKATGFDGCHTDITVTGSDRVMMNRTGAAVSTFIIEKDVKQHCVYGTPYGDFMVGITSKKIESNLGESGGFVNFKYVLDVNSSYVGDFAVSVEVRPDE